MCSARASPALKLHYKHPVRIPDARMVRCQVAEQTFEAAQAGLSDCQSTTWGAIGVHQDPHKKLRHHEEWRKLCGVKLRIVCARQR